MTSRCGQPARTPVCWARAAGCRGAGPAAPSDLRLPSRVHITEATLSHLDKAYEVEDGHGQQRDPYLKEMNIRTYLVIDPRVRGLGGSGRWCPHPGRAPGGEWGRGLPGVGVSSPSPGKVPTSPGPQCLSPEQWA